MHEPYSEIRGGGEFAGNGAYAISRIFIGISIREYKRCSVYHKVDVAGEDTRTAPAVRCFLHALCAFRVMMTVHERAAHLCTDQVELVPEIRHIRCGIFVAGDDFVDRVDDDQCISLALGAPYNDGRQLVHWYRLTSKVPDVDIFLPI